MPERLSERVIARLAKSTVGREAMTTDAEVPSLFVRVHASGVASFVFRHRARGRVYKATLGRVGALGLADARNSARVYIGRIALGFDPIAEKNAEAERYRTKIEAERRAKAEVASAYAFTVGDMVKAWAATRKDDTRSVRYVADIKSGLKRTFASVLDLPARDLSKGRIEELVEAAKRRGPAAAARAQVALGLAYKCAIKAGKLEINPCVGLETHKLKPRARTLNATEIRRVWRAAGTLPSPFGGYVRFLIATGVRRSEALGARWSELEDGLWHIPATRMKGKRAFTVPLTRAALHALPERGAGDFIFSTTDGTRPIGGPTRLKAALDAAVEADGTGPLAPWWFHDLRRSLATWLSDRGVDYVIADLCLGHAIPLGQVGRVYQRSYKIVERRQALELWSAFLDPEPAESAAPGLRLIVS